ncbi:MAG: PD-(D/E)XK nuclease family protein [Acidiferrobacterales bacterium]
MNDESYIYCLPYDDDILDRLTRTLLARHPLKPVDLGQCVILFPVADTRQRFRLKLLEVIQEQDSHALIPPVTTSMNMWLEQFRPDKRVLNHNEQELLLFQALAEYPHYIQRYGAWPLIDSLLSLFQELTLNNSDIASDANRFRESVEVAYGTANLAPLNDEANLVHTLWKAWRAELDQRDVMDSATAHIAALRTSADNLSPDTHVYLAGFQNFTASEQQWIDKLGSRGQIDVLTYGETDRDKTRTHHDKDSYSDFLKAVFASHDVSILTRTQKQKKQTPISPVTARLRVLEAGSLEQEARGIDIQVRQWMLQGKKNIGIVSNDRRLARRVRALLERANIVLVDSAGWTLSTTSAASVITRWLDCIETNFDFKSLLDFLKSPFTANISEHPNFTELVGHFEESVVFRAGTTADLARYLSAIEHQQELIDERAGKGTSKAMADLLARLKSAAQPLLELGSRRKNPLETYFTALHLSLSQLGVLQTLEKDDAGAGVIEEIETLVRSVAGAHHPVDWQTFRTWLTRNFERRKFKPAMAGSGVELMGFTESRLYRFDALVIGGTTREYLPGDVAGSPFFNESVRTQLSLPSGFLSQQERLADFRHLLQAAPQILVSCNTEDNGNPAPESPWLQRIQAFHSLAYDSTLEATELLRLTRNTQTLLTSDKQHLPQQELPPDVQSIADLLPRTVSATSYQRLINCPFQFFSRDQLGLSEIEEINNEVEKRDYGSRVHRVLQAFHSGTSDLPGPFGKSIRDETIDEAKALLTEISDVVFARDIQHHPTAQGWLNLWQRIVPGYLTWQQQREQNWSTGETEHAITKSIHSGPDVNIGGRIDRLDYHGRDISLIDYKTGKTPSKKNVTSGESVQLLFYALLTEKRPIEVLALELRDDGISTSARLQNDELDGLIDEESRRLQSLTHALVAGAVMPAWGDTETCQYCEFEGICRKEFWVGQD